MTDSPDARRLRAADQDWSDEQSRRPDDPAQGSPSVVVMVVTGSANVYCSCTPEVVTGAETEGTAGTLTDDTGTITALNLGTADPTGKNVIITFVDFRWVFLYSG